MGWKCRHFMVRYADQLTEFLVSAFYEYLVLGSRFKLIFVLDAEGIEVIAAFHTS